MRSRLITVALVLVLFAELPLLIPPRFPLTDHLVFWKAGQLVVSGGSPFDMAAWAETQRTYASEHLQPFVELDRPVWVYPAWTAFLFAPFGLLPYPAGPWVLHLCYLAAGLLATILFARSLPLRWQRPAELAVLVAAIFQPLVIADRYGQFGALLLLGAVLVFRGVRDRRALPLAAGALLLFAKPQLFVIFAPAVLILLVRRRAWRIVGIVTGVLATVAVATTLRYPESVAFFARGAGDRTAVFTTYSSTWAFAHYLSGDWWPITGGALVVLATAATIVGVRRLPADLRLAGTVAGAALLSIVVAPVAFHYDQVSLLPFVVVGIAAIRRPDRLAPAYAVAVVVPWAAFFAALRTGGPDSQALSGVAPLLVAPLLLLVPSGASPTTPSSPTSASTPAKLK